MFNPYVSDHRTALRPVSRQGGSRLPGRLLNRLGELDSDDLLILLLVYLVAKEGDEDGIWPLAAALLYLML